MIEFADKGHRHFKTGQGCLIVCGQKLSRLMVFLSTTSIVSKMCVFPFLNVAASKNTDCCAKNAPIGSSIHCRVRMSGKPCGAIESITFFTLNLTHFMKRLLVLLYGVVAYCVFFGTFLYMIGFVGNLFVPKSIDGELQLPLMEAILINAGLLSLFAVQHSVMARPAFKRWWTRFVPESMERSTFVLLASLCLLALAYFWQPMGGVVWAVENGTLAATLTGISLLGWGIVLVATFMINHFDLFGLRQVWLYFQGKKYEHIPFRLPLFYKYVRHPLYLGFIIAFWAAPVMTFTHLFFAVMTTGYILVAIQLEEGDLVTLYGDKYRNYKKWAPMLIPSFKKLSRRAESAKMESEKAESQAPIY